MREKGEPLERALPDAGIERIRLVMITVGATIPALFPLALEGGPLWKPLCVQATEGGHDQIPRTTIPRISLHHWNFRASARHQRPHVRFRVAGWHRIHWGFLFDPGLLHHPFSLLQALRTHGSSNKQKPSLPAKIPT